MLKYQACEPQNMSLNLPGVIICSYLLNQIFENHKSPKLHIFFAYLTKCSSHASYYLSFKFLLI